MRNVRYIAILASLFLISACSSSVDDFNNAYSVMGMGKVGPISLDD